MSNKKLAIKGVFSNWLGFMGAAVLTLIVTPFIVHTLGNERYGIWSLVMSLTGYYGLMKLGVRSAVTKYVAEFKGKEDHDAINEIVNTALVIFIIVGSFVFIIAYFIANNFTDMFKVNYHDYQTIKRLVIISGTDIAIIFCFQSLEAILIAYKRFDISNSIAVANTAVKFLLIYIFLSFGYGLVEMAIIILCVDIISNIVTALFAFRLCGFLRIRLKWISMASYKKIFNFGIFNFMRQLSRIVAVQSGSLIAGIYLGMEQVTFYSIAESLLRYGQYFSRGINSVILPLTSELDAQEKRGDIKKIMLVIPKYQLLFALLLGVMVIVMGKDFIRLWMGPDYVISYAVLCVLMVSRFGQISQESLIMSLVGMGKNKLFGILAVVESLAVVLLSILLVGRFGIIGIAIGALIPFTITYSIIVPVYSMRVIGVSLSEYVRKAVLPPVYTAIFPAILAYYLVFFLKPATMLQFLGEAVVVGFVMLVCSYFFCFDKFIKSALLKTK